ncbi:hypothetical protein [Candidatus Amarolinea dominans]|uniref:hypothetical protein n=1 Tax=Candidatus Amarolinea dominans TaxID=3140696 RepID=UPI0031CCB795
MYSSLAEMVDAAEQQGKPLYDIVITAELKQSRRTREEIWERMRQRLLVMRRSAEMGIAQPVRSLSGISGGSAISFGGGSGRATSRYAAPFSAAPWHMPWPSTRSMRAWGIVPRPRPVRQAFCLVCC